jgi:N-methylhydantoinase B/oxoprolinase/acetone carboxylase alpha subunit
VAIVSDDVAERMWPGGTAIGKRLKMGGPDPREPWLTVVGVAVDRLRKGADGVRGGQPGARGEFLINGAPADPNVNHTMQTGDIIAMRTPGGGGFGDPAERSAALIERDRIEGYCA